MLTLSKVEYACDPAWIMEGILGEPYPFFLDSWMGSEPGRWSFAGCRPFLLMTVENGTVFIDGQETGNDPLWTLQELLAEYGLPKETPGPPFACGTVGFLSYDLGRYFEKLPSLTVDDLNTPDLCLAFYDCCAAFDNVRQEAWVCNTNRAKDKAAWMTDIIKRKAGGRGPQPDPNQPSYRLSKSLPATIKSDFTRDEYISTIHKIKSFIASGDVYQINLAQRFQTAYSGSPWSLYSRLRIINPSPFGCFLDFPRMTLAGVSPERLLQFDPITRKVETRPIKGTRPRGKNRQEDLRLRDELYHSIKDRAENVMIVDLERNDLGRVCDYGSVKVSSLWSIEPHPNVFQMVSIVEGRLSSNKGAVDLISACFPGGSITGAPKVRAMQIIEELEKHRRGIYTGSVGYIDFRGNMDLNIVIRSIVLQEKMAYFHGGGGIVIDSVAEDEYQETLDKVSGIIEPLEALREE